MARQYIYILLADSAYETIENALAKKFPSYEEEGSGIVDVAENGEFLHEIDAAADADPDEIREFLKTLPNVIKFEVADYDYEGDDDGDDE